MKKWDEISAKKVYSNLTDEAYGILSIIQKIEHGREV